VNRRDPSEYPEPDHVVDASALVCPGPVIALAKAAAAAPSGSVLAVLAEDPATANDVPAWCRMRKHEFLGGPLKLADGRAPAYLVRIGPG
jgi:tRNA 2-thiouridine synthesizing protein A